ncbi:MAG TPA: YceI family protein [Kofleriaceae bacterium]|jgi:polyisoprenoid-binding protein YceI
MPRLALLIVVVAACSRTADPPSPTGSATAARPQSTSATDVDHIDVLARHNDRENPTDRANDPVVVHITKYTVTKAHFDPAHLDGGAATIELDLTSIESASAERDTDLQAPEWLDTGRLATATVDVANVAQHGAHYTADAAVSFHGVKQTYPVTFDVLSTTADSVRIRGEQTFSRLDFAIGTDPEQDHEQRVDTGLTLRFVLTIKQI